MDKHYWKNAYRAYWDMAASKELAIKGFIERETGLAVEEVGLGAGSADYIVGSAGDNRLTRGDADLYVPTKDCYIEVTGPNVKMAFDRPLWVRPDKLRNTYRKRRDGVGKLHVIAHVLTQPNDEQVVRIIVLDDLFFDALIGGQAFPKVTPLIRGRRETYFELPPRHETICTLGAFVARLRAS